MDALIRELLVGLGEDPSRPGLEKTPARVARSWQDLTSGMGIDPHKLLAPAVFPAESDGTVVCRDIHFVSVCEHHLLPFFGDVTIAFVPDKHLVGISKLVRVAQAFGRRLQVQERLGQEILETIESTLCPRGVLVHIKALHLCMMARGVQQQDATMVTLHTRGDFHARPELVTHVLAGR